MQTGDYFAPAASIHLRDALLRHSAVNKDHALVMLVLDEANLEASNKTTFKGILELSNDSLPRSAIIAKACCTTVALHHISEELAAVLSSSVRSSYYPLQNTY